jgi:hypothetical protein
MKSGLDGPPVKGQVLRNAKKKGPAATGLPRAPMEIPPHELDLLRLTAEEAADLAASGKRHQARSILEGGLYRAETLRDCEAYRWTPQLVRVWAETLAEYERLYGSGPVQAPSFPTANPEKASEPRAC